MLKRVPLVVLMLLACIWLALIFDFADVVGYLGKMLNHVENGKP